MNFEISGLYRQKQNQDTFQLTIRLQLELQKIKQTLSSICQESPFEIKDGVRNETEDAFRHYEESLRKKVQSVEKLIENAQKTCFNLQLYQGHYFPFLFPPFFLGGPLQSNLDVSYSKEKKRAKSEIIKKKEDSRFVFGSPNILEDEQTQLPLKGKSCLDQSEIPLTVSTGNYKPDSLLPKKQDQCFLDQPETSLTVNVKNEDNKYYKFDCLSPKKQEQWNLWKNLLLVDDLLMEEGLKLLGHWPNENDENEFDDLFKKIEEWREKEIRRLSAQDYLHY